MGWDGMGWVETWGLLGKVEGGLPGDLEVFFNEDMLTRVT